MASSAGLYGVNVARHDPKLDHWARFDIVRCDGRDADQVEGFVEDVHSLCELTDCAQSAHSTELTQQKSCAFFAYYVQVIWCVVFTHESFLVRRKYAAGYSPFQKRNKNGLRYA